MTTFSRIDLRNFKRSEIGHENEKIRRTIGVLYCPTQIAVWSCVYEV